MGHALGLSLLLLVAAVVFCVRLLRGGGAVEITAEIERRAAEMAADSARLAAERQAGISADVAEINATLERIREKTDENERLADLINGGGGGGA